MHRSPHHHPAPLRVLLADDHELYAESLAAALAPDDRLEVAGHAENGCMAIALALRLRPDVVLMDVRMPLLDGIEATRRLHADAPEIRVVMLSSDGTRAEVERARAAGAVGYLTKDAAAESIAQELLRVTWSASAPRGISNAA
jgi:DNA-binding NarL/FixJ family response regulator